MGSRSESAKHYKKYENKWKKELKDINKQNKMLYIVSKKYVSHCETDKIKKIKAEYPKKRRDDIRDSSSDKSYSDYSLSRDSD